MAKTKKSKAAPERDPIVVDDRLYQELKRLGTLCLTCEQIRKYYECEPKAWYAMLDKYPKIRLSIDKGRADKIEHVSTKLFNAISIGNMPAIMFFLKTQAGWRESNGGPAEGDSGAHVKPALTVTVNDPIEAAKIYQQIMLGS